MPPGMQSGSRRGSGTGIGRERSRGRAAAQPRQRPREGLREPAAIAALALRVGHESRPAVAQAEQSRPSAPVAGPAPAAARRGRPPRMGVALSLATDPQQRPRHAHQPADDRGFSVSFSPDGRRLAVGWWDGRVDLWDVPGRRLVRADAGADGPAGQVAFSPVRNLLAATSEPMGSLCMTSTPAGNRSSGGRPNPSGRASATWRFRRMVPGWSFTPGKRSRQQHRRGLGGECVLPQIESRHSKPGSLTTLATRFLEPPGCPPTTGVCIWRVLTL